MLYSIMPYTFKYIKKALNIRSNILVGTSKAISYTGLSSQVNYIIKFFLIK